ncbi:MULTISPECIES: glycosyltransferase family 4 protein [unclassified Streptomyces]|uniref:glycosyltransferase family 4 protein n=1 Tax=unclassified Streptomyces TaxID=2593676 RepID=UPI0022375E5D|nr:glycosyltransferase family 4 protein [Streptomyces sp. SHP 1-2]MCW5251091.1 glycosyltransferase family 4 protein [Streptomyces sp. SHP 1-2]
MTPVSSHAPLGQSPLRTVQVLGGGNAGSSAHVRSLAAGLVARGVHVTVCAPLEAERAHDFAGTGAGHVHVPRSSDPVSVAGLRAACSGADLVHAHGLHASFRAALALSGRRVHTPLVVTWHGRTHTEGPREHLLRVLERRVMRAASVVLGTTSELVDTARRSGARDARLGAVGLPRPERPPAGPEGHDGARAKLRAELGAVGRPLLVAAGPLERRHGLGPLLDAARAWRRLDPAPLVVVAGEDPARAQSQRRIEDERLPVLLLGDRDDVPDLLAAADLALLPAGCAARPAVAKEALHARVPLVAAGSGLRELLGDAAEIVPPGDADAFAEAVVGLLGAPERREALADAGLRQAATWPTEDETVAQVLSVYDELTKPLPLL